MSEGPASLAFGEEVRAAWSRFVDEVAPLRPELFRFCLQLTGNAFDAEDLVHDGMLRAFGTLALSDREIRNPRGYLLRVLSNLWIDEKRRASRVELVSDEVREPATAAGGPDASVELSDAAHAVLGTLTPRERIAVVLKEAFDLKHAEIAELLSVSEGAVKVALHRGRRRLEEERTTPDRQARVSRELVERFVEVFKTYDIDAVKMLLLETAEATVHPEGVGRGRDQIARRGWLFGSFYHHVPEREARRDPYPLRLDVREVEGEPVVLVFRRRAEAEALEEVWRFEEEDGRIARIHDYGFSPDLVRWIAQRLGLPFREVGYRLRPGIYAE